MKIRTSTLKDFIFLELMLFEAFFWQQNQSRPKLREFLDQPNIARFLADWDRVGDRAVIAEENKKSIGAAWFRLGTDDNHGYGYINPETPELGIGVIAKYRSTGIGRKLINALIDIARTDGFNSISLSVNPGNFALKLYESVGFVKVGESGTSWTMLLQFDLSFT